MSELEKLLDNKSPAEVAEITKACMCHLLEISMAKATLARVYPEAERIVRELEPSLIRPTYEREILSGMAPQALSYGA